jgi:pyruvate,water dikinase
MTDIERTLQTGVQSLENELAVDDFGTKSRNLSKMIRAGLPVPKGWALSWEFAQQVTKGHRGAIERLLRIGDAAPGLLAVRSSAIGEDGERASFAGQHLTILGVSGAHALVSAVVRVERSGETEAARTYRQSSGVSEEPKVAVTIQKLLDPEVAGVMFTVNPLNGDDERLAEAAWGLGDAVVSSRVSPDSYRIARGGVLLSSTAGVKRLSLHPKAGGGIEEREIHSNCAAELSLSGGDFAALDDLATRCETVFGHGQDIEWAKAEGCFWLLQSRPITSMCAAR